MSPVLFQVIQVLEPPLSPKQLPQLISSSVLFAEGMLKSLVSTHPTSTLEPFFFFRLFFIKVNEFKEFLLAGSQD